MLGHPCLLVSITSPYTLVIACFRSSCTCVPTHAPAPQTQRLKAYLKTIEDNSRQRHTSFANFRRRLEASSGADAGWKQLLEQEILHLQEHVESVNRDLVSCAMALRESLSTHDDANNLIVLLNLSRDRRRETRNNIILYFKQQQVCLPATSVHLSSYAHARTRTALRACHVRQEKLKSSGASVSSKVDELVNFIMDHYSVLAVFIPHLFRGQHKVVSWWQRLFISINHFADAIASCAYSLCKGGQDQMEALEQGDNTIQRLLAQVLVP